MLNDFRKCGSQFVRCRLVILEHRGEVVESAVVFVVVRGGGGGIRGGGTFQTDDEQPQELAKTSGNVGGDAIEHDGAMYFCGDVVIELSARLARLVFDALEVDSKNVGDLVAVVRSNDVSNATVFAVGTRRTKSVDKSVLFTTDCLTGYQVFIAKQRCMYQNTVYIVSDIQSSTFLLTKSCCTSVPRDSDIFIC